jgi:hypothetical protein
MHLRRLSAGVGLAMALVWLHTSLAFANIWPTLGIKVTDGVSVDTGLALLALALWLGRSSSPALSAAAVRRWSWVWVVLIIGHYIEATARALYGRSVNIYWDLKLLPDVGSMFAFVARPELLAAVLAVVLLLPLALYLPTRLAWTRVVAACEEARGRQAIAALGALLVSLWTIFWWTTPPGGETRAVRSIVWSIAEETAEFVSEASGLNHRPLPDTPALDTSLTSVQGADVLVLFLESYGMTSWERPEITEVVIPARDRLTQALADTGYGVVTTRVESTTFGGESWLAHISLLSGIEVRDPDVNRRLMLETRTTLPKVFTQAGYRTFAVMPGILVSWPEGRFYGFDRIHAFNDLKYAGPPFGWWDVTDQFALARLDQFAADARRSGQPVMAFMPSISTHAPFMPVPPYQPDWSRMLTATPYDDAELQRAYEDVPDWTDLTPGYSKALAYTHDTLAGYLRTQGDRDLVLVVVGDHQPAALITGEGATWDVPAHVITRRPALLQRLRDRGFIDGLPPPAETRARMDTLLPLLLSAFGSH